MSSAIRAFACPNVISAASGTRPILRNRCAR